MTWNISLSCLYRNLRPLVLPTLTPAKWWAAWKPNTRGLSMVWPSQRSGILTIPWAQRSPLKTRSECSLIHWMVTNLGVFLLVWIMRSGLSLFSRLQRDWSWLLTQLSHQTQGKEFLYSTGTKASDLYGETDFSVLVFSWVMGDAILSLTVDCKSMLYWAIRMPPCDKVSCFVVHWCISQGYFHTSWTSQSSCSENCKSFRRVAPVWCH